MKLIKKEIEKILDNYNLGKLTNLKFASGGKTNYNFEFKTNKGIFIVRIIGYEFNKKRNKQLKFEFEVLDYLNQKKFPYPIPKPINGKNGYLLNIKEKAIWAYKKLPGKSFKKMNTIRIKEIAFALATYHEFIKNKHIKKKKGKEFSWLIKEFKRMRKIFPENNLDQIMLKEVDFFYKLALANSKCTVNQNILINHGDFNRNNILFNKFHLIGIVDFESVFIGPKIRDITYILRRISLNRGKFDLKIMKIFLDAYEKISSLSKEEKANLIPYLIINGCIVFWWTYNKMDKVIKEKEILLKKVINETKIFLKKDQ